MKVKDLCGRMPLPQVKQHSLFLYIYKKKTVTKKKKKKKEMKGFKPITRAKYPRYEIESRTTNPLTLSFSTL